MLAFMLRRLHPLLEDAGTTLVVATSDGPGDDDVASIALSNGVAAVRGSEHDVLARYGLALAEHPADLVVRLTADCPLIDTSIIRRVVDAQRTTGADYASNTLARTFPDGLDVEVMTADALRWANAHAERTDEREHVTPHVQRHPRTFQICQVLDDAMAGDERWTVDRPEDLEVIRAAVKLAEDPMGITWTEILDRLGRRRPPAPATTIPTSMPHERGGLYLRRWTIADPSGPIGSATVAVDEGGVSTLQIDGPRPDMIEAAVRERLQADLQVTELKRTKGATT